MRPTPHGGSLSGTLSDPSVIEINELYSVSQSVTDTDGCRKIRSGCNLICRYLSRLSSHSNVDILYVRRTYTTMRKSHIQHTYTVVVAASCSKG